MNNNILPKTTVSREIAKLVSKRHGLTSGNRAPIFYYQQRFEKETRHICFSNIKLAVLSNFKNELNLKAQNDVS